MIARILAWLERRHRIRMRNKRVVLDPPSPRCKRVFDEAWEAQRQ